MTKRTREINICTECHEPSFTDLCLYCRTALDYKKEEEKNKPKEQKW
jgi:hypothetical protein